VLPLWIGIESFVFNFGHIDILIFIKFFGLFKASNNRHELLFTFDNKNILWIYTSMNDIIIMHNLDSF
jgi:hypothetical protein